ncbi:hypothetical protein BUALT_Bualt10G0133200 [Buddleja alternifolia]|uniref:Chaperone DnaJ-domain superfamily protein n=1 Tax=Buddleja alternifolia TaxID=168488 RepID=A0AAV6X6M9_9LAMI|nr:hypothetical protein BUALT_Bualt10G0133200 [Buddleja alternifolia]
MQAAASSSTGTSFAYYVAVQKLVSPRKIYRVPILRSFSTYSDGTKQRKRLLVIRNTSDESATATGEELEAPVEAPLGPPSLISALNVEKALRGIAITDVDHYGRLGLQNGCSYDQVTVAYKNKVTEVMNRGLDEEQLGNELELLKESHSILSSIEERRLYDWSLARNGKPDRFVWPFEVDITQAPPDGTPPPRVHILLPAIIYIFSTIFITSCLYIHLRVR